ncbi:hypothetical protein AREALGSMS7_01099 [Arenibacter algicola]|uniref:Uncharacterized protein n=1 Tax=Arenibacter algicola TaxID=616991 RepID=A0A221UT97_9FLAO|nr:hypothetical protein AREALGSMS7_01099 [Arenibacter algicola]
MQEMFTAVFRNIKVLLLTIALELKAAINVLRKPKS